MIIKLNLPSVIAAIAATAAAAAVANPAPRVGNACNIAACGTDVARASLSCAVASTSWTVAVCAAEASNVLLEIGGCNGCEIMPFATMPPLPDRNDPESVREWRRLMVVELRKIYRMMPTKPRGIM